MLATGEGVAEDDAQARAWYERASRLAATPIFTDALRGLAAMLVDWRRRPGRLPAASPILRIAEGAGDDQARIMLKQWSELGSAPEVDLQATEDRCEWLAMATQKSPDEAHIAMYDIHVLLPHEPGMLARFGEALGSAGVSLRAAACSCWARGPCPFPRRRRRAGAGRGAGGGARGARRARGAGPQARSGAARRAGPDRAARWARRGSTSSPCTAITTTSSSWSSTMSPRRRRPRRRPRRLPAFAAPRRPSSI